VPGFGFHAYFAFCVGRIGASGAIARCGGTRFVNEGSRLGVDTTRLPSDWLVGAFLTFHLGVGLRIFDEVAGCGEKTF
jgi:hypothetical protein